MPTLPRAGDRPLSFDGDLVASISTKAHRGPCENRWWELALYRTRAGKLVLAIGYCTQWQGEHGTDTVHVLDSTEDIVEVLHVHPYLVGVHGFPPGRDEQQARLEHSLSACWEQGVTELLAHVEPERLEG